MYVNEFAILITHIRLAFTIIRYVKFSYLLPNWKFLIGKIFFPNWHKIRKQRLMDKKWRKTEWKYHGIHNKTNDFFWHTLLIYFVHITYNLKQKHVSTFFFKMHEIDWKWLWLGCIFGMFSNIPLSLQAVTYSK